MAVGIEVGLDLPFQVSPNSAGIPQFAFVKLDTAGGSSMLDVIAAAANTDTVIGVNQDSGGPATTLGGAEANATAGMSVRVRQMGVSKVVAGAAVSRGDLIVANGSGQAITAPALAATSVRVLGIALDPATGAGDLISVLLFGLASSIVNA